MKNNCSNNISVISFDLDNALYDNSSVLIKAETVSSNYLQEEFKLQDRTYNFDDFLKIRLSLLATKDVRFENLSFFRQTALTQYCAGLTNADEIASKAFELFIQARSQVDIPAEIQNMLACLSKKYNLVSVTNGNCEMNHLSIAPYFSKNYSASQNLRAKPHPQMLLQVLKDFDLQPTQLLHVGDSIEKDAVAAKNAQVDFFHFAPFEQQNNIQHLCNLLMRYLNVSLTTKP